jgi:hypothetical protein
VTPEKQRDTLHQFVSTSALHQKRKKTKAPLVVTEVRRSDKLKAISHGFKGKHCEKFNYFCCSIDPPSLSKNVIRSLGTNFCKIKPVALSEETLHLNPAKKKAVMKISRTQANKTTKKDDNAKKENKKK